MKMSLKITAMILLLFIVSNASAQDKVISFAKLPTKAQTFVKKHFSENDVTTVIIDTEYLIKKEYEVRLKNGSKIEFNSDGEWEKIEMKGVALPIQVIPLAISQYIHKSFPNTFVKEVKKQKNGYEVEISNGLDLEFSKKGEFIRVDD
ncbi:PepSY-like domain-containing protein [Sphingobacterium sp. DN00404]|uniref:PepSY-like domain-containing protein n=1 Tax=Sphingobacterium micropteri TaxID=2763501 RepID=A0ABR7YJB9_9SPHI|nr:PepSY-like domain-containing protein [Sphingobacterium micropteri]MBD1431394.1 PepSY-like domain-containing protein [Sphingobacterium micropteri]